MAHVVCTGDESAVSDVQRFDGVYAKLSARRLTSCGTPVFNSSCASVYVLMLVS